MFTALILVALAWVCTAFQHHNKACNRQSSFLTAKAASRFSDDRALIDSGKASPSEIASRIYKQLGILGTLAALETLEKQAACSLSDEALVARLKERVVKQKKLTEAKLPQAQPQSQSTQLLLTRDAPTSSSSSSGARSAILQCVETAVSEGMKKGNTKTKEVVIKVCNKERYKNEVSNYLKVCGTSGTDGFTKFVDYQLGGSAACLIAMESGEMDLQRACTALQTGNSNSNSNRDLKRIFQSMAASLSKIHSKNLVWCDLKLENFLFVPSGAGSASLLQQATAAYFAETKLSAAPAPKQLSEREVAESLFRLAGAGKQWSVKAIGMLYPCLFVGTSTISPACFIPHLIFSPDLESAVRAGAALGDFSPQVLAPEQCIAISQGELS
jgi:serine/threonine protein kinase